MRHLLGHGVYIFEVGSKQKYLLEFPEKNGFTPGLWPLYRDEKIFGSGQFVFTQVLTCFGLREYNGEFSRTDMHTAALRGYPHL